MKNSAILVLANEIFVFFSFLILKIIIRSSYATSLILGQHLFSLTHAASNYNKVMEENRKLYNQVQDLKGEFTSLSLI